MISPDVGFVCRDLSDYRRAIEKAGEIEPAACREKAMGEYHYHRMAAGFVREYEIQNGIAVPRRIESSVDTRLMGKAKLSIAFSSFSGRPLNSFADFRSAIGRILA